MEWGYIQNSLKNNVFEDYYFDKNNRKLIIDLENVLITLSGENFNYLETAQKLPNYKAFEKWQEEHKDIVDTYNDKKKAKTINDIIAEAKELIGYRVSSYNQSDNVNNNLSIEEYINLNKNQKNSNNIPYVLEANNNIIIDSNTISNSDNSFTSKDWDYVHNCIVNNKFFDYYFDEKNKNLTINFVGKLVTLSGEKLYR